MAILTKLQESNLNVTDDFIMTDSSLGFAGRYIWTWPKIGLEGQISGDVFSKNAAGDPIFSPVDTDDGRTITFTVSGVDPRTGLVVATTKVVLHVLGLNDLPAAKHLGDTGNIFNGTTGVDIVYGGSGVDQLTGNGDNDHLYGQGGNDTLDGSAGIDKLYGGDGNDKLYGRSSGDWLYGEKGNDKLYGNSGADWLNGGSGNDSLDGGSSDDWLVGGSGDDKLSGGTGNDTLIGGAGADELIGGFGANKARYTGSSLGVVANLADPSQNTNDAEGDTYSSIGNLTGTTHDDTLVGNSGENRISGSSGDDTLMGAEGNDDLFGGAGADALIGGSGTDKASYLGASEGVVANLTDPSGNTNYANGDTYSSIENLTGTTHDDTLTGTSGANRLSGSWGDDLLHGGLGIDKLVGGLGKDTFVFDTALGSTNIDKIDDFTIADDMISLDDDIFTDVGSVGGLASTAFYRGIAAHDASDRIIHDDATGKIWYDADGDGGGAAVQFATVRPGLALTAAHFDIIA